MFILDVQPEQHREVPVLMSQAERCAGDGCRNARPDPGATSILQNMVKHHNHFHVYMQPPKARQIEPNLLLAGAMPDSNAVQPAKTAPVKLTPAIARKVESSLREVCRDLENASYNKKPGVYIPPGSADPGGNVAYALEKFNVVPPNVIGLDKIRIIQAPTNGVLSPLRLADADEALVRTYFFHYTPNKDFLGTDHAVFEVEIEGYKIRVGYVFQVVKPNYDPGCPAEPDSGEAAIPSVQVSIEDVVTDNPTLSDGYPTWQQLSALQTYVAQFSGVILSFIDAYGNPIVLADNLTQSATNVSAVTVSIADLQGAALGQSNGNGITLDTNAAGNGWFIDTTPSLNEEFLPTSNPNEWVAKAGSAAAGKMDMLSVLLHEYGHALGIDHSADPNDFMGTTLTAGVRKLPSAEEMALMQSLVVQAKVAITESTPSLTLPLQGGGDAPGFPTIPLGTSFIGFLGLLRSSRYGGVSIAADANTLVTQYAWAANTTLVNGSLNAIDGWSTQGGVEIIPPSTGSGRTGGATLTEVSGSQTRLSQVFLLNPTDRFLSFTLSGTALDDLNGAPDDAFEVALLDANTGASLLGGTGQTRSDAFLNLQANGTQNLANCVTCINNADGSRTYRVDLAGVPAGIAANLSFDLIGFGGNGSHVTVSDVRLSGLPQLHDEAATMLEDGTLAFDPFAQVDNAAVLQLGSHVVDQPAHGAVTVNADGTFSYTPQADYFGTDSFTYRLSDGPLESNLATVSITLTAVNDAPVVADVQATTAEDTALVIALGAYATDVDSTTLTTQIVTGPAHGVLIQNADGSYT